MKGTHTGRFRGFLQRHAMVTVTRKADASLLSLFEYCLFGHFNMSFADRRKPGAWKMYPQMHFKWVKWYCHGGRVHYFPPCTRTRGFRASGSRVERNCQAQHLRAREQLEAQTQDSAGEGFPFLGKSSAGVGSLHCQGVTLVAK